MRDFERRVKEEIEKTGLPTQIKATKILKDRRWAVFNEYPYIDREKSKRRLLDIRAYKPHITESGQIEKQCILYIECKKSSKRSWAFYTESMPDSFVSLGIKRLAHELTHRVPHIISDEDQTPSIFSKVPIRFPNIDYKIALSHQIIFGEKDDFHEAEMQILKAIHYDEPDISNDEKAEIIPIILFDGYLFECFYEGDKLRTPGIGYTRYLSHGLPNQKIPTLIDVITMKFFPRYLELIEEALFS